MKTAILVLTPAGLELARRIRGSGRDATIFGPSCVVATCLTKDSPSLQKTFATDEPGVIAWRGPLRLVLPAIWAEHDAIVAIMALGIVVRLLAPMAASKTRDPAVVSVDDAGRFAIAVMGGHAGGANALAREVAGAIGAQPIITTASDAQRLPSVDLIGREFGWTIERAENLTRVAASVVRREPVGVFQDCGEPDWWQKFGPWPSHFVRLGSWDEVASRRMKANLVISDRLLPEAIDSVRTIVYRPRTLVAGIGCKRDTSLDVIVQHIERVFSSHGLSLASLAAVATVTLKADEPALIAFARNRGVPLLIFSPDELQAQPGTERPSEVVRNKIGIPGVSEPAALRAAGVDRLLVPKQKGPGVTVAVARTSRPFPIQ